MQDQKQDYHLISIFLYIASMAGGAIINPLVGMPIIKRLAIILKIDIDWSIEFILIAFLTLFGLLIGALAADRCLRKLIQKTKTLATQKSVSEN